MVLPQLQADGSAARARKARGPPRFGATACRAGPDGPPLRTTMSSTRHRRGRVHLAAIASSCPRGLAGLGPLGQSPSTRIGQRQPPEAEARSLRRRRGLDQPEVSIRAAARRVSGRARRPTHQDRAWPWRVPSPRTATGARSVTSGTYESPRRPLARAKTSRSEPRGPRRRLRRLAAVRADEELATIHRPAESMTRRRRRVAALGRLMIGLSRTTTGGGRWQG